MRSVALLIAYTPALPPLLGFLCEVLALLSLHSTSNQASVPHAFPFKWIKYGERGRTSSTNAGNVAIDILSSCIIPLIARMLAGTGSGIGEGYASGNPPLEGLDMSAIMGDSPKPIAELFPATLQDSRTGRQYWHVDAAVAEAVAKELFDRCSQAPPPEKSPVGRGAPARARVPGVQMSLGKLMGHPAITGGRDKRVDVDDALWLCMRHWLVGTIRSSLVKHVIVLRVAPT